MKYLFAFLCLFPLVAFANWKADVTLAVDGETFESKALAFSSGNVLNVKLGTYSVKLTLKEIKGEKNLDVTYLVEQTSPKPVLVNKGSDLIGSSGSNDIYAKGETGQPNTIITLNFLKP